MKKNITINLCGRLFNIDEDAYELLQHYMDTLRSYFAKQAGGDEIADDIEIRIAELFDELKQQGIEAINIEHVTEIIHRIGSPEELTDSERTNDENNGDEGHKYDSFQSAAKGIFSNVREKTKGKRLYRDPIDKKLMGVLSGFANYFGGDVVWWRLGYTGLVLLFFTSSAYNFLWFMRNHWLYVDVSLWGVALVVAYVVLAILMPVAETPEDRLRMKGKEVNPQNLAEELAPLSSHVEDASEKSSANQEREAPSETPKWEPNRRESSGCVSTTFGCIGGFFTALWTVITTLFRWCIYAFGAFIAVLCLLGIAGLGVIAISPENTLFSANNDYMHSPEFTAIMPSLIKPFYIFVITAIITLAITAYAIIHSLLNEFKQMPPMPYRQRITLLVMWIIGAIVAIVTAGVVTPKLNKASDSYLRQKHNAYLKEDYYHDGIYIQPHEWKFLQKRGWRILNAEGCNDRFTAFGEYYLENRHNSRYLDCYDERHQQRYRAERTDTLMPGRYKLTCAARANGRGAFVYTLINGKKQLIEIPATGNVGGTIWQEAKDEVERLDSTGIKPSEFMREIARANNGRGYGWNRLEFNPIIITKPTAVSYGLTSDPQFTGQTWLGQYFSACDFIIEHIEK
ncbi:MAG: PspC domain-containing protein [Muribaculaceae bacterium]|nr:PspC domain-containing protein [Muribaculaceae bacterium]